MLRTLFEWLDAHPHAYWAGVAPVTLAYFALVVARLRSPSTTPPPGRDRWLHALLLFAFLLAWRWPFLFAAHEYNPDESQLIAGALTLWHDPVFWRSVDGTTSGPLNFYALWPLHFLGLPFDYFSARLTGLLLVWLALLACHRLLAAWSTPAVAALLILPGAVFFAAATDWDFVHYSSEHTSLALMALAALGLLSPPQTSQRLGWAGAFAAGLLPWAKLQSLPLAAALVGWKLWTIASGRETSSRDRQRQAAGLLLAAAIPSLMVMAAVTITGQLEPFVRGYILQNIHYVGDQVPLTTVIGSLVELSMHTGHFPAYLGGSLVIIALAGALGIKIRRRPDHFFISSGLLTAAAVVGVITPGRDFLHYLLLIPLPLTLWMGATVGAWWLEPGRTRIRRGVTAAVLTLGVLPPLAFRMTQPAPAMVGRLTDDWRWPHSLPGAVVRAYSGPDDPLAVWGWDASFYVESGRPQATRDAHTQWSMVPSPQRDHHRQRYLDDFKQSEPLFFIDAVGPGQEFYPDRSRDGHESFPALATHVRDHYELLFDPGTVRIYRRTDSVVPRTIPDEDLARFRARARRPTGFDGPKPVEILPPGLPMWMVGDRRVQMLLPPAELLWQLEGTEREVRLEYGFHPRAWIEGDSNGADVILELVADDQAPRLLFQQRLDPRDRTDHRRLLRSRIILPPFEPGTRLSLRTGPGDFNDNAWDWVYLRRLELKHSPNFIAEQFPGFNRVPDAVAASFAYHVGTEGPDRLLMIHAPGELVFNLSGNERRFRFVYGFQEGAHSGGGQTDGAIYRIELRRDGHPSRLAFEHRLDPLGVPSDRGRQQASVDLADIRPDDRLHVVIDPGGHDSWDWTYVTDLQLE